MQHFFREKRWQKKFRKETVHAGNAVVKDGGIGNQETAHAAPVGILTAIINDDGSMNFWTNTAELSDL
jgi:hypothetical protein